MIRLSAFSPKQALGAAAALAAICLSPGSSQAFVVTVNSVQYDVTTFTGTYNANTSKFETAANGGVMPWWGVSGSSNGGATQFAIAVGSSLDFPNQNGSRGPYFAWQGQGNVTYKFVCVSSCSGQPGTDHAARSNTGPNEPLVWAQATPTPLAPPAAPVPAPLPLFGAAAAFGFSRKLRKRIKLAPGALGSALPRA